MNKRSTFKVLFYVKRNSPKKDGTVPVMSRITVNGTMTQFSCKINADPELWDSKTGRVRGKSDVAKATNRHLDKISVSLNRHYQEIFDRDNYVTAEKIKNEHLGLTLHSETLLRVFEEHNREFKKQVDGNMKSQSTYYKYSKVFDYLKEFVQHKYKVSDISFKEIQPSFITNFELFLRVDKGCSINTIIVYIMPLERMITTAINSGWLVRNPFYDYYLPAEETQRDVLTKEEIKLLMDYKFRSKSLEFVRDMFLFCTFTGLAYVDLKHLEHKDIATKSDGHLWITKNRHKTAVEFSVRLLDIPKLIITKYEGISKTDRIFPITSYPTMRKHLKTIAKECGIQKNVTWHVSRHTMATEVCLTNGMSIETVSKILGHKNITTTQIYAKITAEKNNREMDSLAKQLDKVTQFADFSI